MNDTLTLARLPHQPGDTRCGSGVFHSRGSRPRRTLCETWLIPRTPHSAPGRAAASCTSASRSTRTGSSRSCARAHGIDTVVTADVYGGGQADELVAKAIDGLPREDYCLVGAIGHDFYTGLRQGAKGFPRFTDPALRRPADYADYIRMATERSLERCGVDRFDLLMLHNPDRTGYTSEVVWDGMAAVRDAGLTDLLGVAPGPANGFTLDVIDCFERFGDRIDWAMVILNPFEPWPGELVLPAAERHDVRLLTRVVDFGGIFHGDVRPGPRVRRARPPHVPPRRLGRAGLREARSASCRSPSATA